MRLSRSTTVWGPTRVWHEWGPHSFPRLSHVPPSGPCPLLSYLCSRARCEPGLLPVLCVGQVSSHPPLGIAGHPVQPARAAPQDWRAGAAGRPGDHPGGGSGHRPLCAELWRIQSRPGAPRPRGRRHLGGRRQWQLAGGPGEQARFLGPRALDANKGVLSSVGPAHNGPRAQPRGLQTSGPALFRIGGEHPGLLATVDLGLSHHHAHAAPAGARGSSRPGPARPHGQLPGSGPEVPGETLGTLYPCGREGVEGVLPWPLRSGGRRRLTSAIPSSLCLCGVSRLRLRGSSLLGT